VGAGPEEGGADEGEGDARTLLWTSPSPPQQRRRASQRDPDPREFLKEFGGLGENVIALGDLVAARFVRSWGHADWGSEPHAFLPGCPANVSIFPPGLVEQARRVVQGLFGGAPFLALHFRRGDFKQFCRGAPEVRYISHACFYPERQAACCVVRTAKRLGIRHLFLATNGKRAEVSAFTPWGASWAQVAQRHRYRGTEAQAQAQAQVQAQAPSVGSQVKGALLRVLPSPCSAARGSASKQGSRRSPLMHGRSNTQCSTLRYSPFSSPLRLCLCTG